MRFAGAATPRRTKPGPRGGRIALPPGTAEPFDAVDVIIAKRDGGSLTDACGGIPESDLSHVFEVAFRGDVARTRDSAGGGLGLAIARGLVEALGGRIHVANVPGGCRFTGHLATASTG